MQVNEAKKLAKKLNRKLTIKTVKFNDLTRNSQKFWFLKPDFKSIFIDNVGRGEYINSLNEDEKALFNINVLQDVDDSAILKG